MKFEKCCSLFLVILVGIQAAFAIGNGPHVFRSQSAIDEKILITGTGRSGSTFLVKLFSFLNFNTGFNKDNYSNFIYKNCNAGMERNYIEKYDVVKSPMFMSDIANIVKDTRIKIKTVIIPVRDYEASADSRVKHKGENGGLFRAVDKNSQVRFYRDSVANYIYIMTKHDINTIFLDFDRMIEDSKYLFDKLKVIMDEKNIDFETFCKEYDEASLTSRSDANNDEVSSISKVKRYLRSLSVLLNPREQNKT